jgi:hypothetical protein
MSWQPHCAIAQPRTMRYGLAMPIATDQLHSRGYEPSRDLERWSG